MTQEHAAGSARGSRRARLDDLYALELPAQPAISPDGSRVVYVLGTADRESDENRTSLWQVPAGGGDPVRLTHGPADSAPAWSPDGSQIAFLRGGDQAAQIWLIPAAGEPSQLTRLRLGAGAPRWSPDGTRIAFTGPADLVDVEGEDDAGRERRAQAPVVTDRLGYKADGVGLLRTLRSHVHVVDVATGLARQVTRGDWHAGDPAWSPDGRQLAFPAALGPDWDLSVKSAVYVVDADEAGASPRLATDADGTAGPAVWEPGGAALLVVRAGAAAGHARLWRVPLDGGKPEELAADLDRNVMPGAPAYPGGLPCFTPGGQAVLFCGRDRGCTVLYTVGAAPATGGGATAIVAGDGRVVSGLSVAAAADLAAVIVADPASYGEVAVVELGRPVGDQVRVLTSHTRRALPDVELFRPTEREFIISDGTRVHGWLLRDPAAPAPAPLLLDIHGGPHNAWHPAADPAHLYHQVLAARGFAVLTVNPRGSDGYGETFYTATVGAWGLADEQDFLEPLDQLVAEGTADPSRLAVAGYSYGGYMTCHLTTRTGRFAAAVAGGTVCDLISMATSDLGHDIALRELGGLPHADRPKIRAQSPLERVERVSTPTLLLHGAADDRCPPGQAEQWFAALRERGVPARLVLYPGGSHEFDLDGRPSHRLDYGQRLTGWVCGHAAGAGTAGGRAGERAREATRPPLDQQHWRARLAHLATEHGVPGAVLGILRLDRGGSDERALAAHGVLNTSTGVAVTTDSMFQIGSITKTWTATLVMQLADEGRIDIDRPLADVLAGLRLPSAELASGLTMRHLLTHTSGIDGDVFVDTGRGDDCVAEYVALLAKAEINHPLGATFSYCNSGYVLAGRAVELITGQSWDAALRERIITPLGLTGTCTLPEEALLGRAAVGHIGEPGEPPRVAPVWCLPRATGPAGAISSTAADVLAFARVHMAGGQAQDGARLLSPETTAAMRDHQVSLPDTHTLGDSWGLGWIRFGWDGHRLAGHDGNTIGQSAYLRVLPEQSLAVALLTNGGHAKDLFQDLFREIFGELAGVRMTPALTPPATPPEIDPARYTGSYERTSLRTDVVERAGALVLRSTSTGPLAELEENPVREFDLLPVAHDLFVKRAPGERTWTPVTFYTVADGQDYLHYGMRAQPRVSA